MAKWKWLLRENLRKRLRLVIPCSQCNSSWFNLKSNFIKNKNTLTGPGSCKKTTRHNAHPSLCGKSGKTNDAKSRKCPKTSIWEFFLTISRSNISKLQIFLKNRFHSNWRSYLVLTSGQKPKNILRAAFREKYQSVWFWANLKTFLRICPKQDFFSDIWLCDFSTLIVP